jgi:phosphoglycolate phosphatase
MGHLAVFDLDGTLVDSPRAIVDTFTASFVSLGAPAPDAAAVRATIGLPLERAFGGLMELDPDDESVARAVAQYQVHFRELILPRARELLYPGVAEGLAGLRSLGLTLAVATSKFRRSADALLDAAGIGGHFTMVVGADQVTHPKPHPESGKLILRELGIPAGNAVMVGDTTHDVGMATAAGMRSIAVTYGVHRLPELIPAGPTWIADSFDEVLTHIEAGLLAAQNGPGG